MTTFILVVAADTIEAKRLREFVESEDFFKARFKGKVAEVHSALRGEESEEATERLVALTVQPKWGRRYARRRRRR